MTDPIRESRDEIPTREQLAGFLKAVTDAWGPDDGLVLSPGGWGGLRRNILLAAEALTVSETRTAQENPWIPGGKHHAIHEALQKKGANSDDKDCPACKGSGETQVYDSTRGPDGETYDIACEECGGTGECVALKLLAVRLQQIAGGVLPFDDYAKGRLQEAAAALTQSHEGTTGPQWITCPATGQQCNDFCDPGKGDTCASSGQSFASATPRPEPRSWASMPTGILKRLHEEYTNDKGGISKRDAEWLFKLVAEVADSVSGPVHGSESTVRKP